MLDEFKNPETREIAVVGCTGWGKTTVFEVCNTYIVGEDPGDTLMIGQTKDMVMDWIKSRMHKVWRLSPASAAFIPTDRSAMTNLAVIFRHMNWFAAPANETSLQEKSMRYCFGDEPWKWAAGMIGYLLKRHHDRWNRKALLQSQGGTEGGEWHEFCRLGKWMDSQHRCPSCETEQGFTWNMFQYEAIRDGNEEFDWPLIFDTVRLRCQHCGEDFADTEKNRRAWSGGTYKWNGNRHIPGRVTFAAPFLTVWRIEWRQVVKEWILAQEEKKTGRLEKLQQIINQRFAQFWVEPADTPILENKGDPYRKKEYHEGEKWEGEHYRFLTIDRQKGHYWAVIRAWKLGGGSRLLWEGKVVAWENLRHLQERYEIESRFVFMDSRYEPEKSAEECERGRQFDMVHAMEIATKSGDHEAQKYAQNPANYRPWNMLMGEGLDGYRVKINSKRSVRRVYSDYVTSRTMAGVRYQFIKFSNLLAKNQLAALMASDGFGIPVDVSKQYQAQMQSERKVEKSPGRWGWEPIKKSHSNNHCWDAEVMQVVAACLFKVMESTVED